jgi:hypothetical protein
MVPRTHRPRDVGRERLDVLKKARLLTWFITCGLAWCPLPDHPGRRLRGTRAAFG